MQRARAAFLGVGLLFASACGADMKRASPSPMPREFASAPPLVLDVPAAAASTSAPVATASPPEAPYLPMDEVFANDIAARLHAQVGDERFVDFVPKVGIVWMQHACISLRDGSLVPGSARRLCLRNPAVLKAHPSDPAMDLVVQISKDLGQPSRSEHDGLFVCAGHRCSVHGGEHGRTIDVTFGREGDHVVLMQVVVSCGGAFDEPTQKELARADRSLRRPPMCR